jgi:tetratricopeptide (TPR) repeat protein
MASPPRLARFLALPRIPTETWQGGLVRLPVWIGRERPYRPQGAVWVSLGTGRITVRPAREHEESDPMFAVDELVRFGLQPKLAGCRPVRVEVADETLARALRQVFPEAELAITVRPDLPMVDRALEQFLEDTGAPPGALSGRGVTVDKMRRFAEAAARFYRAAPWRHLTSDDLIRVEAPSAGAGLSLVVVLGAGGEVFGLSFLQSLEQFELISAGAGPAEVSPRGAWAVYFDAPWHIPPLDVGLWERERLPLAGDAAYPWAVRIEPGGRASRPDADLLAYFEGVLAALAATTEAELDGGRWTKAVETAEGTTRFTFALPDLLGELPARPAALRRAPDPRAFERITAEIGRLLESREFADLDEVNAALRQFEGVPFDRIASTASTQLERAQDLVYQAFDARGRRQLKLVREALALSADCADAYVLLAERASDPEEARRLYAEGVAAGERTLPAAWFARPEEGCFWSNVRTRPYMRARAGLARTLARLGRRGEAIAHYRELVRLNPDDNQGVRYELLRLLIEEGRAAEIQELRELYDEDPSPLWQLAVAFHSWRSGDEKDARMRVRRAVRDNRHLVASLAGDRKDDGARIDTYEAGTPEEAIVCARELGGLWRSDPRALEWLRQFRVRRRR